MVQIATDKAIKIDAPKFNKKKFDAAAKYALTLTKNHEEFYPFINKLLHINFLQCNHQIPF